MAEQETKRNVFWVLEVGESTPPAYVYSWKQDGDFEVVFNIYQAMKFKTSDEAECVWNRLQRNEFINFREHEIVED